MSKVGATIVFVAVVAALFGPAVARFDPSAQELARRLDGPSATHWFGLDELGRDIFSRVLAGSRISLLVGIVVVSISSVVVYCIQSPTPFRFGWVSTTFFCATVLSI